jgi:poly(3-hydroxybutyrate) depolymerase
MFQFNRFGMRRATTKLRTQVTISRIILMLFLGAGLSATALAATKTTTTITSSLNPSIYGEPVTFTAVVTPQPPNGEVITFEQGSKTLGTGTLGGGSAEFTISTLTTGGKDDVKAEYPGDPTFASSTSSAVAQVVNDANTTTTLTASQNKINVGQPVTFTATVAPQFSGTTATGNVIFYNGSTSLGTVGLSAESASLTTSHLPVGTDSITAVYKGSSSFNGSTSNALIETVVGTTKTTTTITSSLNPSIYGEAVTFTAVVTPQPPNGEIITFEQGKTTLGTGALSGGSAKFTISTLTTGGTDDVKAVYPGDPNFDSSTSAAVAQVVNDANTTTTLTASQNAINVGQSVTFTATVAPQFSGVTVTGNVQFYNGSKSLGSAAVSGGVANLTASNLTAGTDPITAVYKGSSSFNGSTSKVLDETVDTGTWSYSLTMTWDGVTRYYSLFVPGVLPAKPPMLMMLHATRFAVPPDNPSTWDWSWQNLANQYGFIVLQPASTYNASSGQWNWNSYFMDAAFTPAEVGSCTSPPATACPDDAGFLRQLIVNMEGAPYNIDPNQVYVAGFSSGAQMAERVGVEISDLVAAIAPTSGELVNQQPAPPPVLVPGNSVATPISVQEWQGTEDTELPPCNYGTTNYSGVIYYVDTVDDTFNYWTQQNQCTTFQTTQTLCTDGSPTQGLSGNIATGCTGSNTEVQFIWEQGVGHSWLPGNNATRWLFLSAHPKTSKQKNSHRSDAPVK